MERLSCLLADQDNERDQTNPSQVIIACSGRLRTEALQPPAQPAMIPMYHDDWYRPRRTVSRVLPSVLYTSPYGRSLLLVALLRLPSAITLHLIQCPLFRRS
jgi:hypothetical protein